MASITANKDDLLNGQRELYGEIRDSVGNVSHITLLDNPLLTIDSIPPELSLGAFVPSQARLDNWRDPLCVAELQRARPD